MLHLNVVGWFLYLDDPGSHYQSGPWSLVGSAVLGRFWLKGQTNCNPSPPGCRLGEGLMSHPSKKKYIITETGHTFQASRRSVENLWLTEREEVRKVGR